MRENDLTILDDIWNNREENKRYLIQNVKKRNLKE